MKDKIMAMEAGNVLDQLIAEGVMGWKERIDFDIVDGFVARYVPNTMEVKEFKPSTDISAAFKIVEKFITDGFDVDLSGCPEHGWLCRIEEHTSSYEMANIESPTITEAICKAALLVVVKP